MGSVIYPSSDTEGKIIISAGGPVRSLLFLAYMSGETGHVATSMGPGCCEQAPWGVTEISQINPLFTRMPIVDSS